MARDALGQCLKAFSPGGGRVRGKVEERGLVTLCYPCRGSVTTGPGRFRRFVTRCSPLEGHQQLNRVY